MSKCFESVYAFLSEEGFRPKREDGYITFKSEGDTYVVFFKDDDEDYISLNKTLGIEFDETQSLDIYKILNGVNSQYIVGKCSLKDDELLIFTVDSLGPIEVFRNNFERYLGILQGMESEFAEEYNAHIA